MRVKKEVALLGATAALIGWLVWDRLSETKPGRVRSAAGDEIEFVDAPAPDLARVVPAARDPLAWERDPFSEPSDTKPLPPLELAPPPLPPLEGLLPPPLPGPTVTFFGRLLRAPATPVFVPGLFGAAGEDEQAAALDDSLDVPPAPMVEALRSLGYVGASEDLAERVAERDQTAEERAAELESWHALYDSIKLNPLTPTFGSIQNQDRFALASRPAEPILFLEVDPHTGRERFPGQAPVAYARERVLDFGFARSVANEIAMRYRQIGETVSPGEFPEVLAFADHCLDVRLEAHDALRTAERVYRQLALQFPDEPAPRIGLARTLEAGFRLDEAYAEHLAILEKFAHRAEVHVALAELEARLRLFESARARFERAERIERTSWVVQWAFGRFLAAREEWPAALEHLELAHKFEPAASQKAERAGIRNDLAAARIATGDLDGARELARQVLTVQADDAGAGAAETALDVLAAAGARASGKPAPAARAQGGGQGGADAGFEELLNGALYEMVAAPLELQAAERARVALETAAGMDPLRAWAAWRALSWLAETSGYPDDAQRYVELALEANPLDPWSLYQRGRVRAQRDDPAGAAASLKEALSRASDFEDALVALGDLAYRGAEHASAERYFERALALAPERAAVHARRGLNLLEQNELALAEQSFVRALELEAGDPVAQSGLAWCHYRRGDVELARQAYAEIDDQRRALGDADPYRLYAQGQLARLDEHANKVQWTDRFERRFLRNGWFPEELASPTIALDGGQLVVRGAFERSGTVRAFRTLAAPSFVSLEAELTVGAANNVRVGIFVSKERQVRGGGSEATSQISIARHREGSAQILVQESATAEPAWVDLAFPEWPLDRPMRVRIEREGEGSATTARLAIDDFVVLEGAPLRSLFASTSDLRLGIFVEGEAGRNADLSIDIVEVVHTLR